MIILLGGRLGFFFSVFGICTFKCFFKFRFKLNVNFLGLGRVRKGMKLIVCKVVEDGRVGFVVK